MLDLAEKELLHLPIWIKTMENVIGLNYAWDRFEVLIMPPNYPYEGN